MDPRSPESHRALIPEFAAALAEDLRKAKAPVSAEVATAAAEAHLMEGKHAAMAILVAAGVPMTASERKFGAGGAPCFWFEVNGRTIFVG